MKNDEDLLIETAAGDQAAFAELVCRHQGKILNLSFRYCRDLASAEELTQEIFFKVWKAAPRFRNQAKFSTWLYRIAVNTCLSDRKLKKIQPVVSLNDSVRNENECHYGYFPDPANTLEKIETNRKVMAAVDRLPGKQRLAIILSRFEEHSYVEIASMMSMSRSAVESLLFRAKQNLLKDLSPNKEKNEI